MAVARLLVDVFATYAAAGILFAAAFVTAGIARVDPVAENAPWGFRLIVMPGVAALWPILLRRWIRGGRA